MLLLAGAASAAAAEGPAWPVAYYDPAAAAGAKADLVLPMPCGGAMAFQRVDVPVSAADPLDDRRIRLGQSGTQAGFSEYLRMAYLRGAFDDKTAGSHFYIGRYEVTDGQWAALSGGDCAAPKPADRFAAGNMSWFDAVDFTRRYSEWLRGNAPGALPETPDNSAFVRLPTEDEWEFAARGGVTVLPAEFAAPLFPMQGELGEYAAIKASGAGEARKRPVGLLRPNPLGLFDIYGNMQELMLEPYRLNAVGHLLGRAGGIVARGGWYGSDVADVTSAVRTEYPMFSATGPEALALPSFGIRLVISATSVTSDAFLRAARESFVARLNSPGEPEEDPAAMLERLASEEIDPARRAELDAAQLALAKAQDRSAAAEKDVVQAMCLSGSVLLTSIWDDSAAIPAAKELVDALQDFVANEKDPKQVARYAPELERARKGLSERIARRQASLGAYRNTLDYLARNKADGQFRAVVNQMYADLGAQSQARLQNALVGMLGDLEKFEKAPDMPDAALLDLANADN